MSIVVLCVVPIVPVSLLSNHQFHNVYKSSALKDRNTRVLRTLFHGLLGVLKTLLELNIGGLDLQSCLVYIVGLGVATESEEGSGLATVTLGPVSLKLDGLFAILERLFVVLLGGVAGGAVREEDVVCGVELDSLCEVVDGGRVVLGEESLVSLGFVFFSLFGLKGRGENIRGVSLNGIEQGGAVCE
jgi:hypothetical protein